MRAMRPPGFGVLAGQSVFRKKWGSSYHCVSRLHCKTCRYKEGGHAWRESLRKVFELPGDKTDFKCPHGLPWDCGPQIEVQHKYVATQGASFVQKKQILTAETQRRFNICMLCEQGGDKGFKCEFHKGCCFGAWRANPDNHCKAGKW